MKNHFIPVFDGNDARVRAQEQTSQALADAQLLRAGQLGPAFQKK